MEPNYQIEGITFSIEISTGSEKKRGFAKWCRNFIGAMDEGGGVCPK